MSPFCIGRLTVAVALAAMAGCSSEKSPSVSEQAVSQVQQTAAPVAAAAPSPTGAAAALDRQLIQLGWAGAAATTYAYAEACDADAAKLDAFRLSQREQAISMGSDAATFDARFPEALELARRRAEVDDKALAAPYRADTCRTMLGTLQ